MPWYVLYTKPLNEKKTASLLAQKGIKVYCPTREVVKQWSDRKKKILEPLFKSIVFVFLGQYNTEQVDVLTTKGAVRFLWWQKKPGIVREEEIEAIQTILGKYKDYKISIDINEGQKVIITDGPLKDKIGKVLTINGSKAYIHLQSIGWKVIVDLPSLSVKDTIEKQL